MINNLKKRGAISVLLVAISFGTAWSNITGPTTPCAGVNTDYTFNNGNTYTLYSWSITNGSVVSSSSSGNNYYVTVTWNGGSGSLSYVWHGNPISTLNITTGLATPSTSFTYAGSCYLHSSSESTTITRTGSPPAGETWYWQTYAGGTST